MISRISVVCPSRLAARPSSPTLRRATGDWLAIIEDDDLWSPRKIEWQLGILSTSGVPTRFVSTNQLEIS